MIMSTLLSVLMRAAHRFDRRLTDGACQHGRYCVGDEKIRHRA
ncbi:hypothetical protein [Ancylobacter gelatini]|nr:hypothetical protein [Ancylobacter gelatini]